MNDTNVIPLAQPEQFNDALTEVLRDGASRLLAAAVEAEVEAHLAAYSDLKLPDGRQRIVRHSPLPEREVQTGIGPVKVTVPRTRDRGADGGDKIRFQSKVVPKYLRRTNSLEGLIPWWTYPCFADSAAHSLLRCSLIGACEDHQAAWRRAARRPA